MQTFKLWLENDPKIPEFKQLAYEMVEVNIRDVLLNGIHPWSDHQANRTLMNKFVELFNLDEYKIGELMEQKYCENLSSISHNVYYPQNSPFEELLNRVRQNTRFVESLTYLELLQHAKKQLQQDWSHEKAKTMAQQIHYNFNELRRFIKSKNKKMKLASYSDLEKYDLSVVLTLEDFENEDRILVREGLPTANFRSTAFLEKITDNQGLLKLTDSIDHFELLPHNTQTIHNRTQLYYNCTRNGEQIHLIPNLNNDPTQKDKAKDLAAQWRTDLGKYCFKTTISKLNQMLATNRSRISFQRLDYTKKQEPGKSTATILKNEIERYTIGGFPTIRVTGNIIKSILRNHCVSMTGTKNQLLEKLAQLTTRLYQEHEPEMSNYFKNNHFIKINGGWGHAIKEFPLLLDLDLRNMILTMYAIRHLRANTILNPSHENNTFDLQPLAQSLIKEEISLSSQFLQVQN